MIGRSPGLPVPDTFRIWTPETPSTGTTATCTGHMDLSGSSPTRFTPPISFEHSAGRLPTQHRRHVGRDRRVGMSGEQDLVVGDDTADALRWRIMAGSMFVALGSSDSCSSLPLGWE